MDPPSDWFDKKKRKKEKTNSLAFSLVNGGRSAEWCGWKLVTRCAALELGERDCGGAASQSGDCAPQLGCPSTAIERMRAAAAAFFFTLRPCMCGERDREREREREGLITYNNTKKTQRTMFFFFLGKSEQKWNTFQLWFDSKDSKLSLTLITSSSSSSKGAPLPPCDQYFVINI